MNPPLLVLRVGYMERYDGPNSIVNGGDYVTEHKDGFETYNFKPSRGKCYGYASSINNAGIDLTYLDKSKQWEGGDKLAGVDVVFIATRPRVGQVVVGWYRNATVFHKKYFSRKVAKGGGADGEITYLCFTNAEDAHLLPESERNFKVPLARSARGFPGQSNVWYPNANVEMPGVSEFIRELTKYIEKKSGPSLLNERSSGGDGGRQQSRTNTPDHTHNALVEDAAVKTVRQHYEANGYEIRSVEAECLGWDLEASKGGQVLKLEVKGTTRQTIYFELTPNEYAMLKKHATEYRVCVVCEALDNPRLFDLIPQSTANGWCLVSDRDEKKVSISLTERVAAVGDELDWED